MSCMGPSLPSDEEVDQATNEVLSFLKDLYRVHSMPIRFAMNRERERDKIKLREVIFHLLNNRNCEEF